MTGTGNTLETADLCRSFGEVRAVDHVSMVVAADGMTGFVGANGAGKTTTMRMIMGVLQPGSGEVLWNGAPMGAAVRRQIGYMPEERGLYPKQAIIDQLVYLGTLKGFPPARIREQAMGYLERFGLAERAKDQLTKLSLGNQQRVQVTAALLGEPVALVLDEPFSGLDLVAVDAMAAILREEGAKGMPILFSSHQLDLVERLCSKLVILAHGNVVAQGDTEELRRSGPRRYRLVGVRDVGWVRSVPGVRAVDVDGSTAILEFDDEAAQQIVVSRAVESGGLREFAPIIASLAEIYRGVSS